MNYRISVNVVFVLKSKKVMTTKRFLFRRSKVERGFVIATRLFDYTCAVWFGYGKPVWWKPRFFGRGESKYGFGLGWLLLCFSIQVFRSGSVFE